MPVRPTLLLFPFLACAALQPLLAQGSPAPPQLATGAKLVILDVVVTDSKQNPVHSLSASDFTVIENNTPERIKSFEEHTAASAAKPEPPLQLPPGTFTNYTSVPANAALNILLLDTLNTPLDAQTYVRNQLRQYLKSAPPSAPLAIFGLSTHLWLLQPFTADPELLRAAIEHKSPKASPLLRNGATGDKTDSVSAKMQESGMSSMSTTPPYVVARMQQFEAEHASSDQQLRARLTLAALNQLARYLAGLPGRKNLIWFSGSFSISILPDGSLLDPFSTVADASDTFRKTTELLARSQVAVYPIDARGLGGPSEYSVQDSGVQYDVNRHPAAFTDDLSNSVRKKADENSTMLQMAEQTGGRAFINTNGLADAVARAIAAGSNYYTLTYAPADMIDDGKFRSIQLRLKREGLTLAYRRGYYADPPSGAAGRAPSPAAPSAADVTPKLVPLVAAPVIDPMHDAMIFGSPVPTQITLKVLVVPDAGEPEATLLTSNFAIPSAHLSGPYRRYDITIAADSGDFVFTPTADGSRQVNLQFRTYLYGHDGKLVNISSKARVANLAPALYASVLRIGVFFHQQISIPVKGEFYLRIGVHDVTADHDGAVEIPVDSVRDLKPLLVPSGTHPLARRQPY